MGFDDALNKGKQALDGHGDKVDGAIDKASQKAQDAAPDQADGAIQNAADKAKDSLRNN